MRGRIFRLDAEFEKHFNEFENVSKLERLLDDAWAAATAAYASSSRASPSTTQARARRTRSAVDVRDELAPPASPSASTAGACSDDRSPVSITCTRLALTPVRGAFDVLA